LKRQRKSTAFELILGFVGRLWTLDFGLWSFLWCLGRLFLFWLRLAWNRAGLRGPELAIDPCFERAEAEGTQKGIQRRINEPDADNREQHRQGRAEKRSSHFRTHFVCPFRGDLKNFEAGSFQSHQKVNVKSQIRDAEGRVNFFNGWTAQDLARALGIFDVHPEQSFHDDVKTTAGELAHFSLGLMEHGAFEPTRPDDAIGLAGSFDEIVQSMGWRSAIGIYVANDVGERRQPETFDEGAAFADRIAKLLGADEWVIGGDAPHDANGVVRAAVENNDELKFSVVLFLKILCEIPQDRLDTALFVVSRDKKEQAGTSIGMVNDFGG